MPFESMTRSIETRFAANYSATPIAYANVPFEPPSNSPWVRLTVNYGDGLAGSLGWPNNVLRRDNGLIVIQVFVPVETGSQAAMALIDQIYPIYEHTLFDDIVPATASVSATGVSDGWQQFNVTIPFRRDRYV